ncbi:hypothetical protein [Rubrivirga marina]|uniref:Uncharacterized protein n=1 Tax=Rubrivirga marina TaxID=1196024 RepID=A0A271IVJ0_9BACT|nr:hypothetical protein [Rubrivirga marina]PAP75266.1 hypothetical protein BSZ37_01810 [Rubrivirga marina]
MGPFDLLAPEPAPRFGAAPRRNAYVELHNLIAAAASTAEFGPADRVRISRRHGVDLAHEFVDERRTLYQDLLDDRLVNGDLDFDDRRVLARVAETLALDPDSLRAVHERAFGTVVSEAVSDDCLEVEERLLLYKLQHLLGLDPRLADGAYDVIARERLLKTIAAALCDGELSPDEEEEIEAVRRSLSLEIPRHLETMLGHARQRWKVRRGEMPTVEVDVDLRRDEVAHFEGRMRWSRLDVRRYERHVGATALQTGRTGGLEVPGHVLSGSRYIGQVVLTDRRILLRPDGVLPDEIRIDRLLQILRFRNGTVLRTKSDRRLYLDPGTRNETFYTVLHKAMFARRAEGPD